MPGLTDDKGRIPEPRRDRGFGPPPQLLASFAIALFGCAMLFHALGTCTPVSPGAVDWLPNKQLLLQGPLAPVFLEFGWYANIPFGVALVKLLRGRRVGRWLSIVQVALVLTSLAPVTLLGASEGPATICAWGVGYWMWFVAHSLVFIASVRSRAANAG